MVTLPAVLHYNRNAVPLYESETTLTYQNLRREGTISPDVASPQGFIASRVRALLRTETLQELWFHIPPEAFAALHRGTRDRGEGWSRYEKEVNCLGESLRISPLDDGEGIHIAVLSLDPGLSNALMTAVMAAAQRDAYFYSGDLQDRLRIYLQEQIHDSQAAKDKMESELAPLHEMYRDQLKEELIPLVEALIALHCSQRQDIFNLGLQRIILDSLARGEVLREVQGALASGAAQGIWQRIIDAHDHYTSLLMQESANGDFELYKVTRTITLHMHELCEELLDFSQAEAAQSSSSQKRAMLMQIVLMLVEAEINKVRNQIDEGNIAQLRGQLSLLPGEQRKYLELLIDWNGAAALVPVIHAKLEKYGDATWSLDSVDVAELRWASAAPVRPKKLLNVALGFLAGIILAGGIVCIAESFNMTIDSAEAIERSTGGGVLGALHFSKRDYSSSYNRLVTLAEEDTALSREYRGVAASLKKLNAEKSIKSLLMIAPEDRDINAAILTNVAIALAENQISTLLVDMNVPHPTLHTLLGAELSPGMTDLVAIAARTQSQRRGGQEKGAVPGEDGEHRSISHTSAYISGLQISLLEILQRTQIDNLLLLTAGDKSEYAAEISESDYVPPLFDLLRSRFECVIINAPPLNTLANGEVLFTHVDALVLLIEPAAQSLKSLRASGARIAQEKGTVAGVVLIP